MCCDYFNLLLPSSLHTNNVIKSIDYIYLYLNFECYNQIIIKRNDKKYNYKTTFKNLHT